MRARPKGKAHNRPMKAKQLATPRSRVQTLYNDMTLGEVLKIMEKRKYQMLPVIERNSRRYLYSVSAGDLLRRLAQEGSLSKIINEPLSGLTIDRLIISCSEDAELESIIYLVVNQNYVPLVDASGVLQGIVTRRAIIDHLTTKGE